MRNTLDSIARRNDRRQREILRLAPLTPVLESDNTAPTQRAVLAMAHARKTATRSQTQTEIDANKYDARNARACLFARIARPESF